MFLLCVFASNHWSSIVFSSTFGAPDSRSAENTKKQAENTDEFFIHEWVFKKAKENWKLLAGGVATIVVGMILWSAINGESGTSNDGPAGG